MISILMETKIYRPAEDLVKDIAIDGARDSLSNIIETLMKVCSECKFKTLGEVLDILFRTYANAGMIEEAHETFQRMKVLGLKPNFRSCNKFLVALRKANRAEFALRFFHETLELEIEPNEYTFSIISYALCREGKVEESRMFLSEMKGRGFEPSAYAYNAFIEWNTKRGDVAGEFNVLEIYLAEGILPNVSSYMFNHQCMVSREVMCFFRS